MKRSVVIRRWGGPETLTLEMQEREALGANEVRVQVAAAGVNFADALMRMGLYPEAPKRPFVPGYEVAGTVVEVGSSVSSFKKGDRVLAGCHFGGYTTEIVVPAFQVRALPAGMTEVEAASIPVNFMTAWVALEEMGRVRKGDRVLIQSAAGGVGVAAIQLAARHGARVSGLLGSPQKFEAVRDLGLSEMISYQQWEDPVASKKLEGQFDLVLDSTGGAGLKRSMRCLAQGGRVVNFGVSQMTTGNRRSIIQVIKLFLTSPLFTPFGLMMGNHGIFGLNMLQLFDSATGEANPLMTRALDSVMALFESKKLVTKIGKTFPLAQAGQAQAYLQSRANVGKVVLTAEG